MDTQLPDINKRLKEIIAYFEDGNVSQFASTLSDISQQRLNRIFKIDKRIGKYPKPHQEIITAICKKYNISSKWVLTGEGNMFSSDDIYLQNANISQPKISGIVPFHQDIIVTGSVTPSYNGRTQIATYVNLGDAFSDATGAMQISGHSMYPNFENGCVVGYREVKDKSYYQPGEVYIIGTEDYQMIKRVQHHEQKGYLLLTSDNDELRKDGKRKYEGFPVEIDKIRFMAIVLGKISRIQMKLIKQNS